MRIENVVCRDLKPPQGQELASTYVLLQFKYKSSPAQEYQSHVIKEFNWTCSIQIPDFQKVGRGFKFASVQVSLMCPRRVFKDTLLGEASIRLGELLERSRMQVKDCNIKRDGKSVGSIDLLIRMRNPIKGMDLKIIRVPYLIIDSIPEALSDTQEKKGDGPIIDVYAPELLSSFDVLTFLVEDLGIKISKLKLRKLPIPQQLQDRYSLIVRKKTTLENDVATDSLSLEDYLKSLRYCLNKNKKLLKVLDSQKADQASIQEIKNRCSIMTTELHNATAL